MHLSFTRNRYLTFGLDIETFPNDADFHFQLLQKWAIALVSTLFRNELKR